MSKNIAEDIAKTMEQEKKPITPEIIEEAKEAAGVAISLLLSPYRGNGASLSGDKAFYAHSLMQFRTEYSDKVPTAGVSVTDKINLYINPHFFLGLTVNKRIELYIHEIEHVMNLHMIRSKELKESGVSEKETHKLYNIATDANINTRLEDLTEDLGVTIARLNDQLKEYGSSERLSADDSSEVHFWKLRQFQEEMGDKLPQGFGEGEGGEVDDHGIWDESMANEEMVKAVVKDTMNKAAEMTGTGNMPQHVLKQLQLLNQSLVNWKKELRQFAVRTLKFHKERTRTKRNRRTGILFPGTRKEPKVKLALIGDESGSMSDKSVAQLFCEVDKIASMGVEVLYIPMDSEAGEVVKYKKGMKIQRSRSGGTQYGSGLQKAKELKVDGIVIFGDMDSADSPSDPKIPVLWAVFGEQEPPAKFGKKITVTDER